MGTSRQGERNGKRTIRNGCRRAGGACRLADGTMYVTEMSSSTLCVTKLDERGRRRVVKTTGGRPNGLAIDGDGGLWVAESGLRALLCIAPDGHEVLRIEGDGS